MSKLSFKFFVIIIGIALGGLFIVSLFLNLSIERYFADYLFLERKDKIQQLKEILEDNYRQTGSLEESAVLLNRFSGINNLYIELKDEKGDIIYSTEGMGRMGMGQMGSDRNRRGVEIELEPGPAEIFVIEHRGQEVGKLQWYQISSPKAQNRGMPGEHFTEKVNQAILLAAGVIAVLTIAVSYYFSHYLTKPLLRMNEVAARVADGDLAQSVKVRGNDEVAELADTFNLMVNRLRYLETIRRESTSDLAHELRTPLTTLNSYLEAIEDGVLTPDGEILEDMREELNRLIRLVNKLGELAAAEKKAIQGKREKIQLEFVLADIVAHYRLQAEKKGLEFRLEIEDNNLVLMADRDSLETIFNNLLSNALKYTEKGRIVTKAGLNREKNQVVVKIVDSGIGIPEQDLPYIFERFYRSDKSRSTATGGTGIGLTIARELIEAHDGKIEVESVKKGTTFTICFPLASSS